MQQGHNAVVATSICLTPSTPVSDCSMDVWAAEAAITFITAIRAISLFPLPVALCAVSAISDSAKFDREGNAGRASSQATDIPADRYFPILYSAASVSGATVEVSGKGCTTDVVSEAALVRE